MTSDNLIAILALVVAGVWAIVAVASLIQGNFTALSISTPVMMAVVGFIMGRKKTNGGS